MEFAARRHRRQSTPATVAAVTALVVGLGLATSAVVGVLYGEVEAIALATTAAVSVGAGTLVLRLFQPAARIRSAGLLAAVATAWLTAAALSSIAYLAAGSFSSVERALFESISGVTTTGMTVVVDVEGAPRAVLLWRAMTEWIGGFGAVVVAVAVLPFLGAGGTDLIEAETRYRSTANLVPRVADSARRLGRVYAALSAVLAVAYFVAGMGAFDAVCYAMTTASTGGFANHADSFLFFDKPALEWVAIFGMIAAGTNFGLFLRGGYTSRLRRAELRAYVVILVVASTAAVVWMLGDAADMHGAVRHGAFAVVAVVTTTGHAVVDWGAWVPGAQVMLLGLMGVGAMSGSTGGGFRIVRAMAMVAFLRRELVRQLHPHANRAVRVGRAVLPEALLGHMIGYQVLYLIVAGAVAILVALTGNTLFSSISIAVSALSTIGPGLGDLGPAADINALTAPARMVLAVAMLAGRLDVFPVLALAGAMGSAARRFAARGRDRVRDVRTARL